MTKLKNVKMTTVAPDPHRTISTLTETVSGVEPVFSAEPYQRRIRFDLTPEELARIVDEREPAAEDDAGEPRDLTSGPRSVRLFLHRERLVMTDAQKLEAIHRELYRLAAQNYSGMPPTLPPGKRPHDFDIHIDGMIGFDGETISLRFEDSEWSNAVEGAGATFTAALDAAYTALFGRAPLSVIAPEEDV